MNLSNPPLIVGAGPVGLAAALLLARQGRQVRLVEERREPSRESRALAVNPRTLEILEGTGVAARMIELGRPIGGALLHRPGRPATELSFAGLHPRYPFMLALSQAATERLLSAALEEAGGAVERGVGLAECRNVPEGVEVVLDRRSGRPREVAWHRWMLAADGAHSTARHRLGLGFPGSTFEHDWHLVDVPLDTDLRDDRAHVFLRDHGEFCFQIPVVDGDPQPTGRAPLWRVITNRPEPLSRLPRGEPGGPDVWSSAFSVSHRMISRLARGNVYFAGDAAHVHSPIGARGMNLGIEDAWVFARLVLCGRLVDYARLRRPVDRRVVRQVELISRLAAGESALLALLRGPVLSAALRLPMLRRRVQATLGGLDHPLPPSLRKAAP